MKGNNLFARWTRLGWPRRLMLIEALATVAAASAAVRLLPFKQAVQLGSRRLPANKASGDPTADASWAVEAAARNVPWRAMCIQKGIALQWMLRRRGVNAMLHYGVARDAAGEIEAHVWVAADDRVIIGGEEAARFSRVATFPLGEG